MVTVACYPENPGVGLGELFKTHVKETGQPETFPNISTDRPPEHGEIAVLAYPVSLERGRRPVRDMAPCPICSPAAPKWLRRGTFLWSKASSAIYSVGPKCSTDSEWSRKLALAQNEFSREERERQNAANLAVAVKLANARLSWIAAVLPAVKRVDQLQDDLGRKLPILRRTLGHMAKGGDSISVDVGGVMQRIGRIKGDRFLRSIWREAEKLEEARLTLRTLLADCGDDDPDAWATALAPTLCSRRLREATAATTALLDAADRVADAVNFLGDETARTITAWRASGAAPHGLRFSRGGNTTTLGLDDKVWRCDQVVGPLPPIPGIGG